MEPLSHGLTLASSTGLGVWAAAITSHGATQPRPDPGLLHGLWGCGQRPSPAMEPLSHGLTLASSTGLGVWAAAFPSFLCRDPNMGAWGRRRRGESTLSASAGATAHPPFQARPTKSAIGHWLVTPPNSRPLKVKARAVSTCENSQTGCLEHERVATRQAEHGGQQADPRKPVKEEKASVSTFQAPAFPAHVSASWRPQVSRRPQERRLSLPPRILEAALGAKEAA